MKITYKDIDRACLRFLFHRQIHIVVTRTFMLIGEQDVLGVNRNGYPYEIEIKMSKADFHADFHKTQGYSIYSRGMKSFDSGYAKKHDIISGKSKSHCLIPRKFWFAAPMGIIDPNDLPPHAGLLIAYPGNISVEEVMKPKLNKLAKPFQTNEYVSLLNKVCYRCYSDYAYRDRDPKSKEEIILQG